MAQHEHAPGAATWCGRRLNEVARGRVKSTRGSSADGAVGDRETCGRDVQASSGSAVAGLVVGASAVVVRTQVSVMRRYWRRVDGGARYDEAATVTKKQACGNYVRIYQ
jgi:hypothetical protein